MPLATVLTPWMFSMSNSREPSMLLRSSMADGGFLLPVFLLEWSVGGSKSSRLCMSWSNSRVAEEAVMWDRLIPLSWWWTRNGAIVEGSSLSLLPPTWATWSCERRERGQVDETWKQEGKKEGKQMKYTHYWKGREECLEEGNVWRGRKKSLEGGGGGGILGRGGENAWRTNYLEGERRMLGGELLGRGGENAWRCEMLGVRKHTHTEHISISSTVYTRSLMLSHPHYPPFSQLGVYLSMCVVPLRLLDHILVPIIQLNIVCRCVLARTQSGWANMAVIGVLHYWTNLFLNFSEFIDKCAYGGTGGPSVQPRGGTAIWRYGGIWRKILRKMSLTDHTHPYKQYPASRTHTPPSHTHSHKEIVSQSMFRCLLHYIRNPLICVDGDADGDEWEVLLSMLFVVRFDCEDFLRNFSHFFCCWEGTLQLA